MAMDSVVNNQCLGSAYVSIVLKRASQVAHRQYLQLSLPWCEVTVTLVLSELQNLHFIIYLEVIMIC